MPLTIESDDLSPLPYAHRQGLVAVAVLASISFGLSAVVLLYLTYKLIRWHITTRWRRSPVTELVDLSLGLAERHFTGEGGGAHGGGGGGPRKKPYPNQFLVLIYNLLLADLHQAAAFLLNVVWVRQNGIEVRTQACFLQGWLVSTGDLSSSCFITAIAVHTYLAIVWNYKPPQRLLYLTIVSLWVFDYMMAILGPVTTHNGKENGGFYVRAAAWVSALPLKSSPSRAFPFSKNLEFIDTNMTVLGQCQVRNSQTSASLPLHLHRSSHYQRSLHPHLLLAS